MNLNYPQIQGDPWVFEVYPCTCCETLRKRNRAFYSIFQKLYYLHDNCCLFIWCCFVMEYEKVQPTWIMYLSTPETSPVFIKFAFVPRIYLAAEMMIKASQALICWRYPEP